MIQLPSQKWNPDYCNRRNYKEYDKEIEEYEMTCLFTEIMNNILLEIFETVPSIRIYYIEYLPKGIKTETLNKDSIKRLNYNTDLIGINIENYERNIELIRKIVIKNYIKDMLKGFDYDELSWYTYTNRFYFPLWNNLNYNIYPIFDLQKMNYISLDHIIPFYLDINNIAILEEFAFMKAIKNDRIQLFIDSDEYETINKYINSYTDFDKGITELLFYYPDRFAKLFTYKNGEVELC